MKTKVWTYFVRFGGLNFGLAAQGDSSHKELLQRLKRDDPIWDSKDIKLARKKKFDEKHFKRNLAIRCVGLIEWEHL